MFERYSRALALPCWFGSEVSHSIPVQESADPTGFCQQCCAKERTRAEFVQFLSSSALPGWGTEGDVGVLLPLLQCLRRCWCLPALARCSPAEIPPAASPGICPCSPLLLSHHSGCVLRGWPAKPDPSPATNTQLWGE